MAANDGVPAGWYTDPSGAPGQRWWDGSAWTDHVTPAAAPTGPPTAAPTPPPAPVAPPEPATAAAFAATGPVPPGPAYGYGGLPPHGGPVGAPVPPSAAPAKKRSGLVVLAVVLVAFLLVGLLGGGAVLALRTAGSGSSAAPVMVEGPLGGPADPVVPSTTSPDASPAPTGRTFTDPDGVYELTIADSWQPGPAPASSMELWRTSGSDGANVNINDGPNIDGSSFDDVRRSLGEQMETMMKGMTVDRTGVAVSTTGEQVVVLYVTNTMNPVPIRQQLYVFVTPERVVTATITAPDSAQADAVFAGAEPYVLSLHVLGDI